MCASNKIQYQDEIAALCAAHDVYRTVGKSYWAYSCETHWHLGKSPFLVRQYIQNFIGEEVRKINQPLTFSLGEKLGALIH